MRKKVRPGYSFIKFTFCAKLQEILLQQTSSNFNFNGRATSAQQVKKWRFIKIKKDSQRYVKSRSRKFHHFRIRLANRTFINNLINISCFYLLRLLIFSTCPFHLSLIGTMRLSYITRVGGYFDTHLKQPLVTLQFSRHYYLDQSAWKYRSLTACSKEHGL